MSAPAFAWAFERGHAMNLSSSQLLLLLYMADQANCVGEFFTGQARMAKFTRLCIRTVRELVPQLEALGLIACFATPGKPTLYRILRQPQGEATIAAQATAAGEEPIAAQAPCAAHTPAATAANLSTAPAATAGGNGPHPGNSAQAPRQLSAATPAATAADPLLPKKEDPKPARAHAPVREAPPQPPDGAGVASAERGGNGAAPPPAATPQGGSDGPPQGHYRPPGSGRSPFDDWLDEGAPADRAIALGATVPDSVSADVPEPEEVVGPQIAAAVIASTRSALRSPLADNRDQFTRELLNPLQVQDPADNREQQIAALLAGCSPEQFALSQRAFAARAGIQP
jgi:helix-turn-helix protein